jgi:cell wall-associated NlpC family hydrolase
MSSGRRRGIALACLAVSAAAVAGCGGGDAAPPSTNAAASTTATTARPVPVVARADDAEAARSSPLPEGESRGPAAPAPASVGQESVAKSGAATDADSGISPGAPSDAEIRAELEEMETVQKQAKRDALRAGPAGPLRLTAKGNAKVPEGAPAQIAAIIGSANAIARFPYVYGGGHGSFVDSAYDCSGSVSYALAGAGLLDAPLTSGALAKWGEPGPGRWVTIYANEGHVFMTVAGVRYDTSGRNGVYGSRWQDDGRGYGGFTVVHPPGL